MSKFQRIFIKVLIINFSENQKPYVNAHEAGFDAFMTGYIFAKILKEIKI